MKNTLKFILLTSITLLFLNCSSDNDSEEIENTTNGKLIFDGKTYNLKTLWITEQQFGNSNPYEINLELFNKENEELENTDNLLDFTQIFIGISSDEKLKQETYSMVIKYDFSINNNVVNGNFTEGENILDDNQNSNDILRVVNSEIKINSITDSETSLVFSFTRKDGKIITGEYSGTYIKK